MTMQNLEYSHDETGVVTLRLCVAGRPMNVLTPELIAELDAAILRAAADESVRGVIVTSSRSNAFMAGADVKALLARHDAGVSAVEAAEYAQLGAALLRRMETCGKPLVAAINGLALGGGLELALACHARVLLDAPGVVVGLPEVTLGLMPGWGGTQRLPRLTGIEAALPLLLDGIHVPPRQARELGIVDDLVKDEAALIARARDLLAARQPVQPWDLKGFAVPGGSGPLAAHAPRTFMAGTSRLKATRRNYPAPHAILSAVYEGTQLPFDTAMRIEAAYFGGLLADRTSGNLMRSFLRKGRAVKQARAADAMRVDKLGILGAGMMGAGIANVAAGAGLAVVLLDQTQEAADRGLEHCRRRRAQDVKSGRISADAAGTILSRITPTADHAGLSGCDLIIEAVFENRAVKADVTRKAEPMLAPGGFFASNTSTLPVTGLAANLTDPSRFIGLHFFSPVERMPLVEVITGRQTSAQTLADALAFVARLKKTPIVVHDSPGFYTSRVFCTYIDEAMAMLAQGISPALIENAARLMGFPVPPLAVTDEVSLDLQKLVIDQAHADGLDARFLRDQARPVVERLVALGRLGRKSGGGFYEFAEDGTKRLWPGLAELFPVNVDQPSAEDVGKRLLYIQSLESARCLAEGVIDDEATADLGSILGIGFPEWTGGALSLISTVGHEAFAEDCRRFAAWAGPRFAPAADALCHAARASAEAREPSQPAEERALAPAG